LEAWKTICLRKLAEEEEKEQLETVLLRPRKTWQLQTFSARDKIARG
jgi:hypothetical protein